MRNLEINKWSSLDFVKIDPSLDLTARILGRSVLLKEVLERQNPSLYEYSIHGNINDENKDLILAKIKELGGRLIYRSVNEVDLYIWENSILEFGYASLYRNVVICSIDNNFISMIDDFISPMIEVSIEKGSVFAITSNNGGLNLTNIGNAGIPFTRCNYNKNVIEDYDYVIKDLNSSSPSGRITILEGDPGTGKTHIVRSILTEVPQAMFVLISPSLVSSLDGPQFLPLLLKYKHVYTGPIILVLEDADKCLVKRNDNNINDIQSLLNLGDGILGSLMDIRIVATTNAKKLEIDSAVIRKGRLSKRIEVGTLTFETATNVYKSLLPNTNIVGKITTGMSLAEVYCLAREDGWISPRMKNSQLDETDDVDD